MIVEVYCHNGDIIELADRPGEPELSEREAVQTVLAVMNAVANPEGRIHGWQKEEQDDSLVIVPSRNIQKVVILGIPEVPISRPT